MRVGVHQYYQSARVSLNPSRLLCSDMYSQSRPLDERLAAVSVQTLEWSIRQLMRRVRGHQLTSRWYVF